MHKHGGKQFRVREPFPATAIPRRASAHPDNVVKPGSRYSHTPPLPVGDDITRIPTLPEPSSRMVERNTPPPLYDLADVNTVPPHVSPDISSRDTVEHASIVYTQYMDGAKNGLHRQNLFLLNPLERVRWWLLYPGRIEFLLLAGGTLLLLGITTLLILVTVLSLGFFH